MVEQPNYLYVEAINLDCVLSDTEDLATRRAGGYMLLQMVRDIRDTANEQLEPVSVGASRGLFRLKPGHSLQAARKHVTEVLNDGLFAQAQVLVTDTEELRKRGVSCDGFKASREALLAAVRQKQMSSLGLRMSFGLGDKELEGQGLVASRTPAAAVCAIDGVRPATLNLFGKSKTEPPTPVSLSVAWRRIRGRELRQSFYKEELKDSQDLIAYAQQDAFTDDFEELAEFDAQWSPPNTPTANLRNKVAIFYADGNGFSAIAGAADSEDTLKKFDCAVQAQRRLFLAALLTALRDHPHGGHWIKRAGGELKLCLRIETLMWGGDEFRLVLPAWLGLRAVQIFFETCRIEWQGERLTHAVGLVFAHHNAPISPLQDLADALAEQGKNGKYRGHDSLHLMVLESFDHAGNDLDGYWTQRGLKTVHWDQMALNPVRLDSLLAEGHKLKPLLPRSSIYTLIRLLKTWAVGPASSDSGQANLERLLKRAYDNVHFSVKDRMPEWQRFWTALQPAADLQWSADVQPSPSIQHLNAWLLLVELWDYLGEKSQPLQQTAGAQEERT